MPGEMAEHLIWWYLYNVFFHRYGSIHSFNYLTCPSFHPLTFQLIPMWTLLGICHTWLINVWRKSQINRLHLWSTTDHVGCSLFHDFCFDVAIISTANSNCVRSSIHVGLHTHINHFRFYCINNALIW